MSEAALQVGGCKFSPRAPRSRRAEPPAWGTGEEMAETGEESLAEVVEWARQEARAVALVLVS